MHIGKLRVHSVQEQETIRDDGISQNLEHAFHAPHPCDVAISQKTFDWQLIGLCDRIRQGIEALLELTNSFSGLGHGLLPHVVAQLQENSADHAASWYFKALKRNIEKWDHPNLWTSHSGACWVPNFRQYCRLASASLLRD